MSAIAADVFPRDRNSWWNWVIPLVLGIVMAMGFLVSRTKSVEPDSFWTCEDTHNAASASEANVTTAITAADDGDCVVVPAGTATWTSLDMQSKDIQLIGATTVTCSGTPGDDAYECENTGGSDTTITGTPAILIDLDAKQRVTGFNFTGGEGPELEVTGNQDVTKFFRIDHNVITNTFSDGGEMWDPIRFYGDSNGIHPQGIWDHNRFVNGAAVHTNGSRFQLGEGDQQHEIWARQPSFGDSEEVVYLEANYWETNTQDTRNYTDGNYSGRSVIRFNTINGPSINCFEYHSPQGDNRGYQRWENYHNACTNVDTTDRCFHGMLSIRGGTGYAFNNTLEGTVTGCNNDITVDNVRSDDDVPVFGDCDGTKTGIDENTSGQSGRHCRDQLGVLYDETQWAHLPSPTAYDQAFQPAMLWGNTRSGSPAVVTVDTAGLNTTHIQANRDYYEEDTSFDGTTGVGVGVIGSRPATCTAGVGYWATDEGEWNDTNGATADGRFYRCTATNTWTLHYTPYTYPHPWTN